MKKDKKTTALFALIFSASSIFSQVQLSPSDELARQTNAMNQSKYVIEGVAIKQENYLTKNKTIRTCTVLKITKIFKGYPQIKLGTIKVISYQSASVGDVGQTISDGPEGFYKGKTYIVFGVPSDSTELSENSISTDNNSSIGGEHITFNNDLKNSDEPIAYWNYTTFKTKDEVYNFLKENGNLILQEAEKANSNHQFSVKYFQTCVIKVSPNNY